MKASLSLNRGFIYNLGNELFPVQVRSQSHAIAEMFAQGAGLLAPFIVKFTQEYHFSPWFIVCGVGLLSVFVTAFLPRDELTTVRRGDGIELNGNENARAENIPLIHN